MQTLIDSRDFIGRQAWRGRGRSRGEGVVEDAAALLMSEWRYDTHPPYQSEKRTMSAAFEITQEDLRAALDRLNLPADETTLERAAEVAFAENERITKAALCGEHLEEQTRCGMDELVAVLSETLGAGG